MGHLCSVNTEGQTGIITEPIYLALQWGGVFNHMAGNMSVKAYAEPGGRVPSNCKQMLYLAHMSPMLTSFLLLFPFSGSLTLCVRASKIHSCC